VCRAMRSELRRAHLCGARKLRLPHVVLQVLFVASGPGRLRRARLSDHVTVPLQVVLPYALPQPPLRLCKPRLRCRRLPYGNERGLVRYQRQPPSAATRPHRRHGVVRSITEASRLGLRPDVTAHKPVARSIFGPLRPLV
jgi:hypothetical protein